MIWLLVLIAVLIASAIVAGIALQRAHEAGEVAKFRQAVEDLESELGKALLPTVQASLGRLARWLERDRPRR